MTPFLIFVDLFILLCNQD